jgi:Icc-related predicted phosphoesterase
MRFRRDAGETRSLFFATDIHGSEACFRKFVAAKTIYKADHLILGGDLTGKMIVPILRMGVTYEADFAGQRVFVDEAGRPELERTIRDSGYYPLVVSNADLDLYRDPTLVDATFERAMVDSLRSWDELAVERGVEPKSILVAPGNDDPFEIDAFLEGSAAFRLVEGKSVDIAVGRTTYSVVSTGYSNPTPWETHREEPEAALEARLRRLLEGHIDPARTILNVHVPPYDSGLDEGPDIAGRGQDGAVVQRSSLGSPITRPVGSVAVRRIIEEFRPLLTLHGHIHESRGIATIGTSVCINPGSDYNEAILRGALIRLGENGLVSHQLTAG